jgi:hypothetical protein
VTDEQAAIYAERVSALWEQHAAARDILEQQAQEGIARDLEGLCAVHGDVIAFIEGRWVDWLDAGIAKLNAEFKAEAIPIAREYGEEWK